MTYTLSHCQVADFAKTPKKLIIKVNPPHHTAMYLQQLSLQLPVNTAEWHIPLELGSHILRGQHGLRTFIRKPF